MLNSSKDTGIQYCTVNIVYLEQGPTFDSVFRIRIRTDPHKEMPPGSGSGSVWTDADPDPDPGGKKA